MTKRLSKNVKIHLMKARESALLAVDIYNKPATSFRSGGYIVLMCIAWTALFHAISFKNNVKPFYRERQKPRWYVKIDGDYKAWELSECVSQFSSTLKPAVATNLRFFVGLRNKIEHRSMPELDPHIFGECQALLLNFEDLLISDFGPTYALTETLPLTLQFSQLRPSAQGVAMAKLHRGLTKDVASYIQTFRSSLSAELLNDLDYSFKVFLVPKIANHPGHDDIAIEFVKFNPDNPEEMENYLKLISLVRPAVTQVANQGRLKASHVASVVEEAVQKALGSDRKFNASYHHAKACSFYGVKPSKGAPDPRKTKVEYCQYDEAHCDYVYTEKWRRFLCDEMKKPGQYERILRGVQP